MTQTPSNFAAPLSSSAAEQPVALRQRFAGSACQAAFGTPLYVYSADQIVERLGLFQEALAGRDHLVCYAVKANSALAILKLLAGRGAGFDIVSGGELERVLAAAPEAAGRVVFSGVGKTAAEIDLALKGGILEFNVESEAELELLAARGKEAQDEGAVCAARESRCVCRDASLHFDRAARAQVRHRYSHGRSRSIKALRAANGSRRTG